MSVKPFQKILCSRSALLTQDLSTAQVTTLLQACVFGQIQADRLYRQAPASNWLTHRFSALEKLGFRTVRRRQDILELELDTAPSLATLIQDTAQRYLPDEVVAALQRLLAAAATTDNVPPAIAWPAGLEDNTLIDLPHTDPVLLTFSLTVATNANTATVIAFTVLPAASPRQTPPPLVLKIALRDYSVGDEFWSQAKRLKATVGDYVARHSVSLGTVQDAPTA